MHGYLLRLKYIVIVERIFAHFVRLKQEFVENLPVARWLGGWLYPQPNRVQAPGLMLVFLI